MELPWEWILVRTPRTKTFSCCAWQQDKSVSVSKFPSISTSLLQFRKLLRMYYTSKWQFDNTKTVACIGYTKTIYTQMFFCGFWISWHILQCGHGIWGWRLNCTCIFCDFWIYSLNSRYERLLKYIFGEGLHPEIFLMKIFKSSGISLKLKLNFWWIICFIKIFSKDIELWTWNSGLRYWYMGLKIGWIFVLIFLLISPNITSNFVLQMETLISFYIIRIHKKFQNDLKYQFNFNENK